MKCLSVYTVYDVYHIFKKHHLLFLSAQCLIRNKYLSMANFVKICYIKKWSVIRYWTQLMISSNISEVFKTWVPVIFVTDVAELDSSRPHAHTLNIKAQHGAALNWVTATKHNSPKNIQYITQTLLIISMDYVYMYTANTHTFYK